jgi:hypothetical protein
MSNLPNSMTFRSFIEIYKAYMLSQDSKDIRIEDHSLDLEIIKLVHHILEVIVVKEETQEVPKHISNFIIVKEETQLK